MPNRFFGNLFLIVMIGLVSSVSTWATSRSCTIVLEETKSAEDYVQLVKRPTIQELERLAKTDAGLEFAKQYPSENERQLFSLIRGAAKELMKTAKKRKVYLFARDGELIHDAVTTILLNHPEGSKLMGQFRLINMSRPITRNHSSQAVRTFLEHNGMNLKQLLQGKEKMLWIDTGFRGSIYISLFGHIFDLIDFSKPSSDVNTQIVNVLKNVEALLITTKGTPSVDVIIQTIQAHVWSNAAQVTQYLSSALYFNEFLKGKRSELGLPEGMAERYNWVVQNIEHNYHFNGRALTLDESAHDIAEYEIDAETNKEYALAQQIRLIRAFSDESVSEEFAPLIETLLGHTPKTEEVVSRKKKTKTTIPVAESLKATMKAGDLIETEDGLILEFIGQGGKGRRGLVYKVKNKDGKILALKLAKDNEADTLESFAEEGKKTDAAAAAGFNVAQILEHKKTYIVKDWIEGTMARDWLANWAQQGFSRHDPAFIELKKVLKESARRGLYTGDLNRKNLIWTNGQWVVIDSGSTTSEYSSSEAWDRYVKNISSRWAKELNESVAEQFKTALEEE